MSGVALYHRIYARESFEKAAQDLFEMIQRTAKQFPGRPRTLYLDIDGHRNSKGGFDTDMFELQSNFLPQILAPFLTEMHIPLGAFQNSKPQRDDLPDRLDILRPEDMQ